MHVCVITRNMNVKNGVATHVNHLIARLEEQGVDVTAIAADVEEGISGRIERIRIRSFNEFETAIDPRNLLLPALVLMRRIIALHKRKPIDLIHFHDSIAFTALRPVTAFFHIPTLFTVHSLYIARPETSPYPAHVARKYKLANRCALKKATKVLCVSSETRQRAVQLAGESPRLLVVPNFIDFIPSAARSTGKSFSPATSIFVGTLSPIKGVNFLIEAIPRVLDRHAEARFLIVGDGSERARLAKRAEELGLGNHIRFIGRVEREATAEWYSQAGIMVVPSLDEAQGIVVLEAFIHGLPVVASKVGGIPDMVDEGRNGLLVPPGDPDAIGSAINRLLDDRALWETCSQNARETALRYSWEKGILQIISLYQEAQRN